MTTDKPGTVKLTDDERLVFVLADRDHKGFWFVCSDCGHMHQWRGGPLRCYDAAHHADPAPVAAGVVCKCGAGFCPAHGK